MEKSEEFEYANKDLQNTNFDEQELSDTNFSGSNLEGATFRHSILRNADFSGANIRGCDFSGAMVSKANFENAQLGISEKRFSELLFGALGMAAFLGIPGGGVNVDNSSPSQSASVPFLAAMYSLAGSILFLLSGYRLFKSNEEAFILPNIALSLVLLIACFLSLKVFISFLQQSSSTSFKNSNLSEAKFNNAVLKNTDFSGANQNDVDWGNSIK
jgi:uncharacterized protein YjbI with pentapeptide repeats